MMLAFETDSVASYQESATAVLQRAKADLVEAQDSEETTKGELSLINSELAACQRMVLESNQEGNKHSDAKSQAQEHKRKLQELIANLENNLQKIQSSYSEDAYTLR